MSSLRSNNEEILILVDNGRLLVDSSTNLLIVVKLECQISSLYTKATETFTLTKMRTQT